jgi:sugar phosphate isomerase/epimerase
MTMTRREFGRLAAAVPAAALAGAGGLTWAQAERPVSKWAGVQVGLNVPYSFGTGNNISGEDLLRRIVEVGISGVELRAQPVEHFLGSPWIRAAAGAEGRQQGRGGSGNQPPAEEVRKWRLSAPASGIREFRRMYEDAGVLIEILKVDGLYAISDDELDFFFQMARDLGARAISAELPDQLEDARKTAAFADKYQIYMAHHHHAQAAAAEYERVFAQARYNGANIDIGHWTFAQNASPLEFIARHHERIPHIHVKDRRFGTNGGQNVPFGEGDTQIREILQAIRDNKWNIQATVEFEYPVPEGSDRVTEIRRCRDYCREVLLG